MQDEVVSRESDERREGRQGTDLSNGLLGVLASAAVEVTSEHAGVCNRGKGVVSRRIEEIKEYGEGALTAVDSEEDERARVNQTEGLSALDEGSRGRTGKRKGGEGEGRTRQEA